MGCKVLRSRQQSHRSSTFSIAMQQSRLSSASVLSSQNTGTFSTSPASGLTTTSGSGGSSTPGAGEHVALGKRRLSVSQQRVCSTMSVITMQQSRMLEAFVSFWQISVDGAIAPGEEETVTSLFWQPVHSAKESMRATAIVFVEVAAGWLDDSSGSE